MDQPDGVLGERGVGPSGDFAVMADVVGGVGAAHPGNRVAHSDALVQRGEHTQSQALPQGGLADQDDRERGSGQ